MIGVYLDVIMLEQIWRTGGFWTENRDKLKGNIKFLAEEQMM